jgi:WD40 repeat protein
MKPFFRYLLIFLLSGSFSPLFSQYMFNVKHTFSETSHQIYHAEYTSDGKYIITTGSDNNIIIWNANSGIIYRTLAGLKKRPNVALFSVDSKILVSAGEDNNITIWDPVTLKITSTLTGHQGPVKSLDISPNGKLLASGSTDHTIRIWDIGSGNLIYELKGHKKDVNSLQFSPDGKKLISGSADQNIILWDVVNGSVITNKEAHKGWIRCVRFSQDGKTVASCGDDKLIKIWSIPELNPVSTLKGHQDWVQSIDFTPDGKNLISGGHDQLIILWAVSSGEILHKSEKQGQIVLSVDVNPIRPDFISASLLSENLKTWAVSGLNEAWIGIGSENQLAIEADEKQTNKNISQGIDKVQEEIETTDIYPRIEIYSPSFSGNSIVSELPEILIIGRISDPEGVNAFLINNAPVRLSDAGVFQQNLSLIKGNNTIELVAINEKGIMNKRILNVECTSDKAFSSAEPITPDIQNGQYYALIIGINEYQDEGIADLDRPIADAESLYNILISHYNFEKENVIFLKNPVLDQIILSLDELGQKLTTNDNLLIFYAGHGHWDEKGGLGYWLPSDAAMFNTVKWFRNSTLRDFIGSIQTRHTILIADACFSGAIFKTRAAFTQPSPGIERLYELPSRKAMTSGILQEVPDESVFIKYLIKRLEENEDKYLPSEALFSSFKTAVMNNSQNVPQFGTIQNVGDEGGDFIFVTR